jgi:dihydroorotate dehydrogenase (fumarate)
MVCSALIRNGIPHATTILDNMKSWMEEHEYQSVQQMRGSMSSKSVDNPGAFERANYMKALTTAAIKVETAKQ